MLLRLLIIAGVIWLVLRALRGPTAPAPQSRPRVRVSDVVRCAHCGLHVPAHEAVRAGDRHYCSPEHRRADRERS